MYTAAINQIDNACQAWLSDKPDADALTLSVCKIIGPPGMNLTPRHKVEETRNRAKREAYKGPTSEIESVMDRLFRLDQIRCRKRLLGL